MHTIYMPDAAKSIAQMPSSEWNNESDMRPPDWMNRFLLQLPARIQKWLLCSSHRAAASLQEWVSNALRITPSAGSLSVCLSLPVSLRHSEGALCTLSDSSNWQTNPSYRPHSVSRLVGIVSLCHCSRRHVIPILCRDIHRIERALPQRNVQ